MAAEAVGVRRPVPVLGRRIAWLRPAWHRPSRSRRASNRQLSRRLRPRQCWQGTPSTGQRTVGRGARTERWARRPRPVGRTT
eukprot:6241904-Alexandrium_andersonii.AAC.1